MMTLVKTMPRLLTEEEKQEMREFILANPQAFAADVIVMFEKKFNTPITETCLMMRVIEAAVPEVGKF
jgi:hypothetical protein